MMILVSVTQSIRQSPPYIYYIGYSSKKKFKKIATRIAFRSTRLLFKNLQNKKGTAEKYIDNMVF